MDDVLKDIAKAFNLLPNIKKSEKVALTYEIPYSTSDSPGVFLGRHFTPPPRPMMRVQSITYKKRPIDQRDQQTITAKRICRSKNDKIILAVKNGTSEVSLFNTKVDSLAVKRDSESVLRSCPSPIFCFSPIMSKNTKTYYKNN